MSGAHDRVTYDDRDTADPDQINELVLTGADVHLEMSSDASGYITVRNADRDVFLRLHAIPVGRRGRRDRMRRDRTRLVDHLAGLLPWRWRQGHPRAVLWSVPIPQRPRAAITDWWDDRRWAGVELLVLAEDDESSP